MGNKEDIVEPQAKRQKLDDFEGKQTVLEQSSDVRSSRRRSTRAVRRYIDDSPPAVEEQEVDDPEYGKLSDSDDDPDFAPKKKEATPEFVMKGKSRGRPAKGRKSSISNTPINGKKSTGTPKAATPATPKAATPKAATPKAATPSPTKVASNNNTAKEVAKETHSEAVSSSASEVTSSTIQVRRRGRPLLYFRSDDSPDSTTLPDSSPDVGSTTTPKATPSPTYSNIARQTQAVRLPEGPQLTPEQLKEIEAQFKSGDFVMSKKDMELENPPIWRIDGKSLLQKFQAFEKDSKILYRNISTYSGWTPQGKTLYVPVKTNFIFQSRYDIVVELIDEKVTLTDRGGVSAANATDKTAKSGSGQEETIVIPDSLNEHMPTFEIFLQSLISQALDSNFLQEIYEENDDYFVEKIKVIEELTEDRKEKIKMMTKWSAAFQQSLDVWPSINIMASELRDKCEACHEKESAKLALFYGQPYNEVSLKPKDEFTPPNKNYNVCEACAKVSQTFNAISHRKFDYYSKCKTTVTNIRVSQPSKNTTTILRELLGNDTWITGLFRAMCTGFVRVDKQYEEYLENKLSS